MTHSASTRCHENDSKLWCRFVTAHEEGANIAATQLSSVRSTRLRFKLLRAAYLKLHYFCSGHGRTPKMAVHTCTARGFCCVVSHVQRYRHALQCVWHRTAKLANASGHDVLA
ncbi:hypothetical protein, variant [Phytophthora nicotianae P10297]|uniref:Uncharacterized protein n=5 Tax=Phytophthora nicotianae TaxID=4792 RepID=V9EDG8_PHYNI|nr:hypothetical protein PPTG_23939 [Phytophthora nicotianae INRA-310]XP_008912351.1 hypothetical protein, variant [Phytophthora nicotianae INRA-310]ETI36951.1 hypothetical protein F443_17051 [Phytophthora nicotianae P1569]ETL83805.1 hypothetical protein L917_16307 [Phytophthora nicotianae]ETO65661.1 hypothetical protein F444_17083 [Phytophthora nicotianae P1976]ETP34835.1 hypothetical protein F442_16909 [Phytophthora nicotianae P10297]ETI36952.1 hypothetical protein, variant [Phytophthora nic